MPQHPPQPVPTAILTHCWCVSWHRLGIPVPYFWHTSFFDPSVKFRFKTQCCGIDGIDAILSIQKGKKEGDKGYKKGGNFGNKNIPVRIYAIYAIYATVFRNWVASG
jgi:hypothetical protein